MIGTTVSHYRILEAIGAGVVYLAEDGLTIYSMDQYIQYDHQMPESDDGLATWNVIEGLAVGQTYPIYSVIEAKGLRVK
jgi:hypothetical protein